MPKIETRYHCNKCDKWFSKEKDAIKCEYSHFTPVRIIQERYIDPVVSRYPKSIIVEFSDGKFLTYEN